MSRYILLKKRLWILKLLETKVLKFNAVNCHGTFSHKGLSHKVILLFWKSHEKQVFLYIHTALTASETSGNSIYFFQPMTDEAIFRVTPLNAYHKSIPAVNGTIHPEGQPPSTASLASSIGWYFYSGEVNGTNISNILCRTETYYNTWERKIFSINSSWPLLTHWKTE